MPLRALDVIWIPDGTIDPPGPKMVVCIEPDLGLFFRINTNRWQTAIRLEKAAHPFLNHDSYLECGEPLDLDEYVVDQALQGRGIIGNIIPQLAAAIFEIVEEAKTVTAADKELIKTALGC